jgi:hypothetical protein
MNWAPLVGGAIGLLLAGFKLAFSEGALGALLNTLTGMGAAWLLVFLYQLLISPWCIWRDGKWYDGRFVYDQAPLAYVTHITAADNNKLHKFQFRDAPPKALIHWRCDVDYNALTNIDVAGNPDELKKYLEPTIHQFEGGSVRVNPKRDLYATTCIREGGAPRTVRIYVTGWERSP